MKDTDKIDIIFEYFETLEQEIIKLLDKEIIEKMKIAMEESKKEH